MKTLTKLFMLLFIVITANNVYGQKLNKLLLVTQYKYTQLPTDPLPEGFEIYILDVKAYNNNPAKRDEIFNSFHFAGFEKKRTGDSDFKLIIEEYPFTYTKELITKERTVKKDDVERKVKYYYYAYSINYSLSSRMIDKNEEEIYSAVADMGQSKNTSEYSNSSDAYKSGKKMISDLRINLTRTAAKKLTNIYSNKFGYPQKQMTLKFYNIKPKKHNYDDFNEAYNIAKEAAEIVKANENDIEKCKETYKPAIKIWEDALIDSDVYNKKARINKNVTCASYYNLGVAYLLLKEFDNAAENFERILEIDKKFFDANMKLKLVKNLKRRQEANQ